MDDVEELKTGLAEDAERYRRGDQMRREASDAALSKVLALLRAQVPPSEVTRLSPFSDAYVRRIAREHGIEPGRPGPKRRARS